MATTSKVTHSNYRPAQGPNDKILRQVFCYSFAHNGHTSYLMFMWFSEDRRKGKERKAGMRKITWKHTDFLYKVTHMRIWVLNEVNENKI